MMIAAMFVFAGHVFAESSKPVKPVSPGGSVAKQIAVENNDAAGDNQAPNVLSPLATLPALGDTCSNAITLPLNRTTLVDTVGGQGVYCEFNNARTCAADSDCLATLTLPFDGTCVKYAAALDDYHSPADTTCFSQLKHTPTQSLGRDLVLSFTAPDAGTYTFRIVQQNPNGDATRTQNATLYASETCPGPGNVTCVPGGGANGPQTNLAVGSDTGLSANQSEEISCLPLAAGQTIYVFVDNAQPNNAGSLTSIEAIKCSSEVEPNATPATANAFVCGIAGSSNAVPLAHCYLGSNAGQLCTRSAPLDPVFRNCSLLPDKRCTTDADCLAGQGTCVLPPDLDCNSRCDVGPNAGQLCTTTAFCNPVSDQGAVCAGTCQIEQTCVDNATGANIGTPCTAACVGGIFPGRYCSTLTGCPGGGVCTQSVQCAAGQTCSRQYNEGDTDFFSLGTPAANSKIFVTVDGRGSTDFDFRARITSDTKTFQFDDDDGIGRTGSNSPVIAGAVTDGNPTYIAVSKTTPRLSSPYEIQASVRGPLATAQLEDESGPNGNDIIYYWPGNVINANAVTNGGYVRGAFNFQGDSDCFKFLVNEGDLMQWWGDGNPTRAPGGIGITNVPQMIIYDAEHAAIENFAFGMAPGRRNVNPNVAQPTTTATSPAVLSFYLEWRATYTGMLNVCYYDASTLIGLGTPAPYPSAYAGSLAVNCGPVQNAGPGTTTADVSITKTGPAGPVQAGQFVVYTITVTNNGTEIAQEVSLLDFLDANLNFVSLNVDDGFAGENTACFSLPELGGNDGAPIDCNNTSMAPGATTTYTLTAQVKNCIGAGVEISNTASITSVSTDPDPSNDSATTAPFTTTDDGSCSDIVCDGDANSCIPELCTENDHCEAGECVNDVVVCDDSSVCTDDACFSEVGCVFDSSQAGDLCDDFNDCTQNACDAVDFCVFPPAAAGTGCDDGLTCTNTDACDGTGSCTGVSVCRDENDCTDDFADETNACACSYAPSAAGTGCDDADACTGTVQAQDTCDGAGLCTGGQAVSCDDSDACTADSCESDSGCVNEPIDCNDGNPCNGVESCDTATGCVGGVPVVCTASDQCHVAGTCDTGTGLCSNPAAPDGTACDDGNGGTSGDSCQGGTCVGGAACTSTNDPKTKGWYKSLCHNAHSGDSLSNADAACVGSLTTTFAGISTVADICAVLEPSSPNNDSCSKAEDQLMTLALNICKERVCPSNAIDSACGNNGTVGQSLAQSDAIFSDSSRTTASCNLGECLDKEINNGHALELDSLLSVREGSGLRLNWLAPNVDDGQGHVNHYTIYRRAIGSKTPFVQIGTTPNLTFVDVNAGSGNWEYDLVPNY
jgi:uncharacterized repeat protein (TIGR01451 family)